MVIEFLGGCGTNQQQTHQKQRAISYHVQFIQCLPLFYNTHVAEALSSLNGSLQLTRPDLGRKQSNSTSTHL